MRRDSAWKRALAGGALTAAALLVRPVACPAANMAVALDGVDDYLQVTQTADLKPTAQIALEAWVKVTGLDSSGARLLSLQNRYVLWVQTNGIPQFSINSSAVTVTSSVAVNDGVWHHVIGQKTGSQLELYVDGVLRGSTVTTAAISYSSSSDVFIGKHYSMSTYDLKGNFDEARIYNRSLSASEIAAHYNAGAGQYGSAESGLVAGWHFDDGSGTTAADYSGAAHTATFYGNTAWTTGLVAAPGGDTTLPTGSVTINSGAASTNSTAVSLTLSATDNSGTVSQMQFSNDGATYSTPEAYATSKAWTMSTGDGTKTVYAKFKDPSGNWSTPVSDTILLDTTGPSGSVTINAGAVGTSSTGTTLTLSAADVTGTVTQMQFSNDGTTYSTPEAYATSKSWTLTSGDGTKTVSAKFQDSSGNWSAAATDTIVLDTTAPVISSVASANLTASAATITWTTGEAATSQVEYGLTTGYGQLTTLDATLLTSHSVGLSGLSAGTLYHYRARSKDALGNERLGADATFTTTTAADTTPPTGTVTINGGTAQTNSLTATLTVSATDNSGSVAQMQFANDGTTFSAWEAYATSKVWTLAAGDGTKTVTAKFKDAAGNVSIPATDTILLDTAAPTGSVTINSGDAATNNATVTLTLSATDASGTVAQMQFSNDGTTYSTPEPYQATKAWTLSGGQGTKTVSAKFADAAGNWSAPVTDTITLDTIPPQISITSPADGAVIVAP